VHAAELGDVSLHPAQRLGHRDLEHEDLTVGEVVFGDAVPGLDDIGLAGVAGGVDPGGVDDQSPQVGGVHAGVVTLVVHLEHVVGPDHGQRDLQPARSPATGHGHLPAAEGDLVAGYGDRGEAGPPYLALGELVEVGEPGAAGVAGLDQPGDRGGRGAGSGVGFREGGGRGHRRSGSGRAGSVAVAARAARTACLRSTMDLKVT
jgi:hypothetical protein